MFCLRCGDELIKHNGELYCQRGEMGFSQILERLLKVALESSPPQPPRDINHIEDSEMTEWFCPRCRHHLHSENPQSLQVHCSQCGLKVFGSIIYELVELHPHI